MSRTYTILMTTMGLNIGGAETHIVELSKELQKQGHRVLVASNGGVYEQELEEAGIRCYHAPMNQRNAGKMLCSLRILEKIIRDEQVDIVHSHARIPGFLVGLLHRRMRFTFVTSAHWVFHTGGGLKYLTNWGQKCVAVSQDIRRYLIENYDIDPQDISVTINGIDTDKFSPAVDASDLKAELGIPAEAPVISYVSRMDEDRALAAAQLIHIGERLAQVAPGLRLLIAGGGNVYDKLKAEAEAVNARLGYPCILMPGSRTDINRVVAAGDLFVGVSRAALEAMAGGKPVVIAGNEGYIGLFGPDKLDLARESNFCCRDCPASDEEKLFTDITRAMALSPAEREQRGLYGRQVIFDEYSVSRMARDTLAAYESAYAENQERQYQVLLSGYYGFHNTGDDAILLSMCRSILQNGDDLHMKVLSNQPQETRLAYGIQAVYRFGLRRLTAAVRECDLLVSGGGSLLQDTTSTRSIMYYLSIILFAKILRKKVMLYANGIGPVSRLRNRKFMRWVLEKADLITLREENSLQELRRIGVKNSRTFVTADPVFTMQGVSQEEARRKLGEQGVPLDRPLVGVSVRNWKDKEAFTQKFAELCDRVARETGRTIVFIVMQNPQDAVISREIQQRMQEPSYLLDGAYTPDEVMGMIGCMEVVLSMRLHTLIFAARQCVPLMGFVYDPKIAYYLETLSMPSAGDVADFSPEAVLPGIQTLMRERETYVKKLETVTAQLEAAARENDRLLIRLLKGEERLG